MPTDVKTDVHKDDLLVDLRGRTAIVTGSSTGIGSAIATRFGESGANVVLDYPSDAERKHVEEVREAIAAANGMCETVQADVSTEEGARALVAAAVDRFGGLDMLINNAGMEKSQSVVEMPLEVWNRIVAVNLTGTFLCSQAAVRAMIARGRGGRIINISSVHEDLAMPKNSAYCASKGGIRMFMRTLALEVASHGITVNDVAPGAIATRINRDVREQQEKRQQLLDEIPLGRVGDPDEVAALTCYLASNAAGYITGSTFVIDGGMLQYAKGL